MYCSINGECINETASMDNLITRQTRINLINYMTIYIKSMAVLANNNGPSVAAVTQKSHVSCIDSAIQRIEMALILF